MPNTYTWTCPNCGHQQQHSAPVVPDNCPRCNYPDHNEEQNDLEGEVGPEAALLQADPDSPNLTPEQAEQTGVRRGQTYSVGPAQMPNDPGWLGEVLREVVAPYVRGVLAPQGEEVMDLASLDWAGVSEGVIERYNGDRPTLLCGCVAGTHGRTFADIEQAHPEREHD